MRRVILGLFVAGTLVGCQHHVTPPPPPPPPKQACVAPHVSDAWTGAPVVGATATVGAVTRQTDTTGYAYLLFPAGPNTLIVSKDGYQTYRMATDFESLSCDVLVSLTPNHVDPSSVPLGQLAAIRGAMWCTRLDVPFGPRPGDPSNCIATDYFNFYNAIDQQRIIQTLKARGYTHVVFGPPMGESYHNQYPAQNWLGNWDGFLDVLQQFWDAGLMPIVFLHPDGWTFEQTRDIFTPLLAQPRSQRLIRIVVPTGWEPTRYDWSSCTWALFGSWVRGVLPNALVLLHTVPNVDAPGGTDARCNDNGAPGGNAGVWQRVAPYYHGWLTQSDAFTAPNHVAPNGRTDFQNWQDLFNPNVRGSYQDRFQHGYAGWPTGSAWGPNTPLKVYSGEFGSYWEYWNNRLESEAQAWGDASMCAGADGYLDGGTVSVPLSDMDRARVCR